MAFSLSTSLKFFLATVALVFAHGGTAFNFWVQKNLMHFNVSAWSRPTLYVKRLETTFFVI